MYKVYSEFIRNVFLKRVVLILLTLVTMVSFSFISYTLIRSNLFVLQGEKDLQQLIKKDVFMGNNQMTTRQFHYNFDEKHIKQTDKKAEELFDYINRNYDYSSRWSFNTELSDGAIPISIDTINDNFLKFYPLQIQQGRVFLNSEYSNNAKEIPVLVGPGLKKKAKLGETFKLFNPANEKIEKYKVIGILKENQKLPSVYMMDSGRVLNKTVFRPLTNKDKEHVTAIQLFSTFQDLLIYNTSRDEVLKLSKIIRKKIFANVEFFSVKENIEEFYSIYKPKVLLFLGISLISLIIFIGLFLWNIWKSLSESRQEIAIRISLGLRKYQLYIITFLYQLMLTIVSFIPITIYAVINTYSLASNQANAAAQIILSSPLPKIETLSLILSFLILLIIGTISSMLTIYKFNKIPLTLRMGTDS